MSTKYPQHPDVHAVNGGSSWGAGSLAGDGSRKPSEYELKTAEFQGTEFGNLMKRLKVYSQEKKVEKVETKVPSPVVDKPSEKAKSNLCSFI
jgi:hypothetical protein